MAGKNSTSRAEQRVSDTKKKKTAQNSKGKSESKKTAAKKVPAAPKKSPKVKTEYDNPIPSSFVVAFISIVLFVLFVVISVNPDGVLLRFMKAIVTGLIGQAGFYFSIPALLYLFILHTFCRKKALKMRSICTVLFVFFSGVLYHLVVQNQGIAQGLAIIADLFTGGTFGTTGGVLCGGFAIALRWACGGPISYLITITGIILTLLGAMQITIPSIIRAIANRPRYDWDEEDEDYLEPAAVVVNHIANKQIEQKRQRRERAAQQRELTYVPAEELPAAPPAAKPTVKQQPAEAALKQKDANPVMEAPKTVQEPAKQVSGKGAAFMNRIDIEIGTPLAGTSEYVREEIPDVFEEPITVAEPEIPVNMPELKVPSQPKAAPKAEKTVKNPAPKAEDKNGKVSSKEARESAKQVAAEIALSQSEEQAEYCFPPIELLKKPSRGAADGTEEMRENSRRLNETLASFNIDAHIINVTRGPSVTRYEVELDKGVRLNKITGCADDIALSLGASGVRIAAVPGKISVVGIEVPNRTVTTVSLREVIDSGEFEKAKSKSSIALGKSIDGNCVIGNISKMPHLLIAGTTGSGKSVCMNSIIISLLYKAGPDDVKLIMVDPKMVELGIYNGIPHLLIPVVTDPKKAAGSLQWAVTEMLRRYKMMSDVGVRDLESYNSIIQSEEDGKKLPQIVIIIDELADLMMVAAKEVEDSICRIAQMGRAAGMHLIIATQRPSANVITGLMKANIPSRIAFSVASAMESRIILDTMGAEKLVGKGDMLYAPIGSGKPLRVQGCFVTDGEVEAVAEYVKENYVADYNQQVLDEIEKKAQQTGSGKKAVSASDPDPSNEELEGDEMLPAAVDVILETKQASVSMLQRRLKLGYARAARIVDEMEEKGIVGPFQGSKPREILITKEQWEARKNGGVQMAIEDLDDPFVPEAID